MKILIGVDTNCTYKSALHLCERLRFPNPAWTLAHSVETGLTFPGYGSPSETAHAIDFARLAHQAGQIAIDNAATDAMENGLQVEPHLLLGNAAESMMRFADENGVDLIAVHSERKGRLGSFFLGSVSRGLAISAKQSILISKGQAPTGGPVNAVYAIDHSSYSTCALERFLEMAPSGIKKIHVLTSVHLSENDPNFNTSRQMPIERKLVEEAKSKVGRVVNGLSSAGYAVTGHVYNLPVDEAINRGMTNAGAELLIMGAQGHGFLHRLTLGSTALHQVVVEPYSVLLLRPGCAVED
jgi:nucleotide-binding universal stress UspA family protein